MCRVIIYKSKTGHTERYARMLSKELNIPCYSYKDAKVSENDEVIFLSYIYASSKLNFFFRKFLHVIGKDIAKDDKELLNLFKNGRDFVTKDNLKEIINYLK